MTKQERTEKLTEVIRKVQMENFRQSRSTYTSAEQIAEALYNAGYRMLDGEENEVLTDAVDATFHGAVLRFAEKLKERIRNVVFISKDEIINWDILIDETAQKFLTCET